MASQVVSAEFVASSSAMCEVAQQVELVRDSSVSVLVTGERGCGKEAVARTIHATGSRRESPFVHVACGELPAEVLAPVLFGDREEGRLELARDGTLYLDGIDELPLELQERLLRVLETGTVTRDGGQRVVPVRARMVASTHHDLRERVERGEFRRDLFCRLNVFPIRVPPLRRRREDVPELIRLLLARHEQERTPPVHSIEDRAVGALKAFDWPGNVAQLESVLLDAIARCGDDRTVRLDHLPAEIRAGAPEVEAAPESVPEPQFEGDTIVPLAELERRAILHALRVTGGNVTRAARALGIGRATMYRKLDRFKLANQA